MGIDIFKKITVFVFLFAILSSQVFAVGKTCTWDQDCPLGEICGGESKCIPCATSAECVKGTFEKSVPQLGQVSPWFAISMLAVMTAILVTSFIFMFGYLLNSDQMKRIGKAELAQAVASLILIAMLFGTELFEESLISMMEKQTGVFTASVFSPEESMVRQAMHQTMTINPFDVSLAFLRKLNGCVQTAYLRNYDMSVIYQYLANLQLNVEIKLPIVGAIETPASPLSLSPSIGKKLSETEYLSDELTWLSIFVYMQMSIMKFAQTSMFTIFLPIGIILRSFPPTRGAGAVMVAVSIGMYMVYPFVYTVLVSSAPKTISGCDITVGTGASTQIQKACPIAPGGATATIEQAQTAAATLEVNMPKIKSGASSMLYLVWVYMLISLGSAFLFTRTISPILGADISEIGRSMFKML